ncbi:hypothetical protein C8Q78DRAFT_482403 [Trametes maxima]|nr:hypothetical protein C8Q78DRAFT_482403 [Trametes maxima]
MCRIFTSAALSFAGLAQTIGAGPLSPVANDTPTLRSDIAATSVLPDTTTATFPATLLLCQTANCVQDDCFHFNLTHVVNLIGACFMGNFRILSSQIVQPSNSGLPFEIVVGTANCGNRVAVPLNECVNLPSDEVFMTFEALD